MEASITSNQNALVKSIVRLRERRERDSSGRFLIEGFRDLSRAVGTKVEFETLVICPSLYLGSNEDQLVGAIAASGARVVEFAEAPFRKVSYRDRPEGLLGVARRFDTDLDSLEEPEQDSLYLVVEAIEKPGNLGTMLRTADAVGASAVIVCDPTTDPFNPNVVRASTGVLFTMPLAVSSSSAALQWLRDQGVRTAATTPETSLSIWEADLRPPVAIVIGAEQYGLSDLWLQHADMKVRIPMRGRADSLNAAMAAGVALFEARRRG